jgi:hypothetical protein
MIATNKALAFSRKPPSTLLEPINLYPLFPATDDPPAPLLATPLCFDEVDETGALPGAAGGEEAGKVFFELISRK